MLGALILSLLTGAILGRIFVAFILLPTCGLAIAVLISSSWHGHAGAMQTGFEIALMIGSLQIGYALTSGLLSGVFADMMQHIRFRAPSQTPTPQP